MKQYRMLLAFFALMLVVSLACLGNTATPAPAPTIPPPPTKDSSPLNPPSNPTGNTTTSGGLQTFTDQNDLMEVDIPGDWTAEHGTGTDYYFDTFTSPDGAALFESIVYDDGKSFPGGSNGKFALGIIHQIYSLSGKPGEIRVSDDQVIDDGSETLYWYSHDGGFSGISNFELRTSSTFLMITGKWLDANKDPYSDVILTIFQSYRVP